MVAKGIGGGFPLGAVLATQEASSGMTAGTHGSTYGGNPLACAVGQKVLEHICDEEFLADVRRKSASLRQPLESIVATFPDIFEEVRGTGLMLGLKCKVPVTDLLQACYNEELITVPAADNVIRLLPPLNLSNMEIDEAITRLKKAGKSCEDNRQGKKSDL